MIAALEHPGVAAILPLIATSLVGPIVGWILGRRRETADIRTQEAARVEHIVRTLTTVVDQLQEENDRLRVHNTELWRQVSEQHQRFEAQASALTTVREELERLRRQAHPGGAPA